MDKVSFIQGGIIITKILAFLLLALAGCQGEPTAPSGVGVAAPTLGLEAYYPFSGNVSDASGNDHHGSVRGSVYLTTDRYGISNSAYHFTGGSSAVVVVLPTLDTVTYAIWFRTTVKPPPEIYGTHFFDTYGAGAPYISPEGKLVFAFEVGYAHYHEVTTTKSVVDSLWHFMAITYDGATLTYHLDGEMVSSIQVSARVDYDGDGDQNFVIGNHWLFFDGLAFEGDVDEFRVYSRALSKDEVTLLYYR